MFVFFSPTEVGLLHRSRDALHRGGPLPGVCVCVCVTCVYNLCVFNVCVLRVCVSHL